MIFYLCQKFFGGKVQKFETFQLWLCLSSPWEQAKKVECLIINIWIIFLHYLTLYRHGRMLWYSFWLLIYNYRVVVVSSLVVWWQKNQVPSVACISIPCECKLHLDALFSSFICSSMVQENKHRLWNQIEPVFCCGNGWTSPLCFILLSIGFFYWL